MANPIRVRSDAEPDAIHSCREAYVWLGHNIHISFHPRRDTSEQAFAEISNRPPGARVDQGKHFLSYMGISAFRDGEIGDDAIEGCVDSAVVHLILSVLYCSCFGPTLIDERLKCCNRVPGLFMLRRRRLQLCPR